MRPLNSPYDQKVVVDVSPVLLTYDSKTVQSIIDTFHVPPDVKLQKISSTTAATLQQLKTQTRAGLEHAISKRQLLDVNIKISSPVIVFPENGEISEAERVAVVDLGSLSVVSDMKHNVPDIRVRSLYRAALLHLYL